MESLKNTKGIGRLLLATTCSIKGLAAAWRNEAAVRQEFMCLIVMIPLTLYLADNNIEAILMIGSGLLVILVELLNSAIETVVDRVGLEYHELSGRAKDIGSAAVFVAIIVVIFTWGLILFF